MRTQAKQRGYLLVTVVMGLFLLAAIAVTLNYDSATSSNTASKELESARVDYVAQAGLQNALWRAQNNACMGDVTIPDTPLGADTYTATITGAASGTLFELAAEQDAWIRSDDVTRNNGTTITNHIRQEAGNVEQVLTRFDLTTVPAGAQINSAIAWFHLKALKPHPQGAINVHEVTADWVEAAVTWESFAGSYRGERIAVLPAQDAGDEWVAINLTGLVQAWVNGQPNFGILFDTQAEGVHTEYTAREDGTNPPRLEVVVGSGPASTVTINATGRLDNNAERELDDSEAIAYQPPGTVTLQLGTDPGGDAMLDSFYERNYGGRDFVQVNENAGSWIQRPVFKFGLGAVPVGAKVISAQLELRLKALKTPGSVTVHRVTQAWVEGTLSGTGQADGATWATYDGTNSWASEGGDFDANAVAELNIAGTETWVSWEVGSLVNDWLAGEPNNGLLIKSDGILEEAEFYSKEEADATLRPRLTITYACACGTACMSQTGSGNLLMAVISPTVLVDEDQKAKDLFESWGYTVSTISESASQSSYDSAVAANDVVFISETVNSKTVGPKLAGATIGVVSQDGDYNPDLGLATDSALKVGADIDVTSTDHYITRPFRVGSLPIYSAGMEQLVTSGALTAGQQTLAQVGGDASLVVLDQGDALEGGGSAAGRRVVLPLGTRYRFDWDRLNANGRLIVQRAIAWGMGAGQLYAGKMLLVVGNASNPVNKDANRRDLFESWGYTVTLIDDAADQATFDTQTAANDVVYVTASISDSTLADKLTTSAAAVVNESGGMLDNLGFSSDTGITVTTDAFLSSYSEHYIAEPFTDNSITVFTRNRAMPVASGTLAPKLRSAAAIGTLTWALPTLEEGAKRWDNTPSPGRRVHLPFGDANVSELTDDGKTLMRRALEWVAGAGPKYGLIAHWRLDEGTGLVAVDSVGGHDGTLLNGPVWTGGLINGGVNFSDETQAISVPHSDSLTITGDLTLLAWVNLDELRPNRPIVQKGTTNTNHNYFFGLYNDNMQFAVSPPGGGWHVVGSGATGILPGSWHHLAVSFDDSTDVVAFYLDGVPFAKKELTHSPSEFAGPLRIGRNNATYGIKGSLDDVRIYRDALSAEEIAEIAERPPIAHWKLDEGAGTIAVDSAGGHDGALVNGPSWVVSGMIGGALDFDGSNDYLDVAYASSLSITDEMSFTAWVKSSSFGSGYQTIVTSDDDGSGSNYWFGTLDDELVFGFYAPPSGFFRGAYTSGLGLQPDTWYHLGATFDDAADEVRLYVDGAEYAVESLTFSPTVVPANISVGSSRYGEYWHGLLDDVRIYDRLLDGDEIAELAAGNSGVKLLMVVGNPTGLSLHDIDRRDRFEEWGYNVTLIDDNASQAVFDAAVSSSEVIYVRSSVSWSALGGKLDGADKGLLNETVNLINDFGFGSGFVFYDSTGFSSTNASHTITSPYGGAAVTTFSVSNRMYVPDGTLSPDLVSVGSSNGGPPGDPGLTTLEAGAATYDGGTTPARRVQLPFSGITTTDMTADGREIMRRAIDWAADTGGGGGGGGGGSAPEFKSFGEASASSNVTSLSIPKPSGTSNGDLLIAALVTDGDSGDTFSPPAGWTEISVGPNANNRVSLGVWWKIATGSESTQYSFTWSGSEQAYGWVMRYTNHDPANPIFFDNGMLSSTNTSLNPTAQRVTPPVDNALVLRIGGFDDDDITVGDPGLDGHTVINMNKSGTGTKGASGGAGYLVQSIAADTGLTYFSLTQAEEYRTVTLAIRPAP